MGRSDGEIVGKLPIDEQHEFADGNFAHFRTRYVNTLKSGSGQGATDQGKEQNATTSIRIGRLVGLDAFVYVPLTAAK